MTSKFLVLVSVIGLASTCIAQAQIAAPSELPAESPSPEKKHRQHKRAEATASPAETAASPATAESPAASPKAKRTRKKAKMEATPSPSATPTASASPGKFSLGNLFKPKSSVSASPVAAPATGDAGAATPAPGSGRGLVWVNTETHVYHKEGSRFYGTTKKGKYLSEADAIKEGDRATAKGQ
jgi:cytoskeletal protein RodZ